VSLVYPSALLLTYFCVIYQVEQKLLSCLVAIRYFRNILLLFYDDKDPNTHLRHDLAAAFDDVRLLDALRALPLTDHRIRFMVWDFARV